MRNQNTVTIDRDRAFDINSLNELLTQGKSILNEAIRISQKMETSISAISGIYSGIDGEYKVGALGSDIARLSGNFGYTIGIPKIFNVGITIGTDGVNISRFLGVENFFETHGNINIGSSSIVEFDSKLEIGWDGNMIGYGASFGVSPVSQVKIYGISETINDNGENIYNETGRYVKTGLVYAVVITAALVYGLLSTAGSGAGVLIPGYEYIMELLGISVVALNNCNI